MKVFVLIYLQIIQPTAQVVDYKVAPEVFKTELDCLRRKVQRDFEPKTNGSIFFYTDCQEREVK